MNNYTLLNLPCQFWKTDVELVVNRRKWQAYGHDWELVNGEEYLHEDLFDWLSDLGLGHLRCQLFYHKPFFQGLIHADGIPNKFTYYWGLNFFTGVPHTEMIWYKEKNQGKINNYTDQFGQTNYRPFYEWKENEVEPIEEVIASDPMLVRIDRPHKVINGFPTSRWCMSIREHTRNRTYEEMLEVFRPFFK